MNRLLSRSARRVANLTRVLTLRLLSAVTAAMLVGVGLAVATAQPAAAYLGESTMTMSLSPGASVVYPQAVVANFEVRDVSDSCEAVVFASCDPPEGYVAISIDGVQKGSYDIGPAPYSQVDDRTWLSVDLGFLDAGVHQIAGRYSGTFDDSSASATLNVSKGDCTMTLTQDKAQTTQGDPVLFSVQTPFEPGDLVTFFDANSRTLGEVPIVWDGWITWGAFLQLSTLPVGTTEVHAFFWNKNYNPCISNFVNHKVVARNTPPVAADDSSYTYIGQPVTVDVLQNDVDAEHDPFTVSVATQPANGQATVNGNGSITYSPNAGFAGPIDTFDYRITEPSGASDVGTVSVFVVCLIERPDSYAVGYNTPLAVGAPGVLANDEHGCDPSRGVWVADPPQHGTVDLQPTGGFTYRPNAGYSGTDTFTYVFMNTLFQAPAASVTLTVAAPPPNRPPLAADATLTVAEGTAPAVTLAGTDPDGDRLSYSVTAGPAHGSLTGAAPNLTYTPASAYVGPDSFDFKVDDGRGGTDTGTVTITVTAAKPLATKVTVQGGSRVIWPKGEVSFENLQARLTRSDTGAPIPAQSITFTVDGTTVCTAVTTATGDATCSSGRFGTGRFTPGTGTTASYGGDGFNLLASSGTATLKSRSGKA